MEPGAQVLQLELAPPAPAVTAALQLKPGEQMVLLKRLRFANHAPIAVETVHLSVSRCPGLLSEDLNDRSLYATLGREYGIVPTRAEQQWQSVGCPSEDASLLDLPPGAPVLRIEQTTFDAEGRPFEHLESYFRGDKFILTAILRNDDRQ
jgi:GntR family transcriptional regulator